MPAIRFPNLYKLKFTYQSSVREETGDTDMLLRVKGRSAEILTAAIRSRNSLSEIIRLLFGHCQVLLTRS